MKSIDFLPENCSYIPLRTYFVAFRRREPIEQNMIIKGVDAAQLNDDNCTIESLFYHKAKSRWSSCRRLKYAVGTHRHEDEGLVKNQLEH